MKNTSTYDAEGNKTEEQREEYWENKLRIIIITKYDKKGRILEVQTSEPNGSSSYSANSHNEPGKVINIYDDEKKTKETVKYKPNGSFVYRVIFTYDDKGNETGWERCEPQNIKEKAVNNSSDINLKAGTDSLYHSTAKSKTEIEYDSHGNWTKKTHMYFSNKDGEFFTGSVEVRVITYY